MLEPGLEQGTLVEDANGVFALANVSGVLAAAPNNSWVYVSLPTFSS